MSSVDETKIQDLLRNNRKMPADDAAMIDWAFYYLNLGFTIFPLKPETKDEFYPYPEYMNPDTGSIFSWKTQASRDPYRIYQFWSELPDASIGAVTGELSGIYVLDFDREHTNHDDAQDMDYLVTDGWERERQWEQDTGMELQETWMDISGSGGNRLYYRADPKRFLNSPSGTADIFNDSSGCDTRGNGRFVVLPPSKHPSGNRYTWELEHLPDDIPIAEADDAFYEYWKGSGTKAGRIRDRKGNILPTESFQPSQEVISA
ncbi:MAG: bifunctional DNA primase/polymerase, partial [Bulleidia sp.]